MLPVAHRLRRSTDFAAVVRYGRRVGQPGLVGYLWTGAGALGQPSRVSVGSETRVGLIVSRSVGGAVVRNRVSRRLRHVIAPRIARVPLGSVLVLRATPLTSTLHGPALDRTVDEVVERLCRAATGRASPRGSGHSRRRGR
ncbi:MAG: ribonuclease P protein component [Actinomycetes bacterium]